MWKHSAVTSLGGRWSNDPALEHVLLCMQSADDVFKLATSKELGQQTGRFFAGSGTVQMPAVAKDAAARQRLWQVMTEQTGASYQQ